MTLIHVCIQAIRSAVSTITGIKPFSFNTIHPAEVQKALNELNPRKAYGQDKISPRILKLLSNELAPSLCKIFNTAIESSKWPEDWKRGTWTPVFKKGNKQDVRNYGPITVIPTAGKIYEKLLCDQISNHMDPILSPNITAILWAEAEHSFPRPLMLTLVFSFFERFDSVECWFPRYLRFFV